MRSYYTLIIALLLCSFSINVRSQFQATMNYTASGEQREYQVFSDENRYRYEFVEDGQKGAVIVLNETGDVFILLPQQKMAMKTGSADMMNRTNDPLLAYKYQEEAGGTEKTVGKEEVNGIECVKKELYNKNNQLLYTVWYSEKYKFPMKMISHTDDGRESKMELKDVREWTPDDASFSVPEGYTVMDRKSMRHN